MREGPRHPTKVAFILNPAAGHGRAARRWARAYRQVSVTCPDHVVWTTAGPGDGTRLARKALEAGYRALVAVGGDGTLGEVVNGYLDAPATLREGDAVATWPAGSGCDFAPLGGSGERERPTEKGLYVSYAPNESGSRPTEQDDPRCLSSAAPPGRPTHEGLPRSPDSSALPPGLVPNDAGLRARLTRLVSWGRVPGSPRPR
jgi:hypothetical protein